MYFHNMQRRKVTLRIYPTPTEEATLCGWLELHRQIYNAALQERIEAWQKFGISISYYDQQNVLPGLKNDLPELAPLGSHALQETLRRLDRSFSSFFRRVGAGQTPGFPRFKGRKRFNSFTYPDPAGWSLTSLPAQKNGKNARSHILRVGDLFIRARGICRFDAYVPNDLTVKRVRQGVWETSITLRVTETACARERTANGIRAFDQGITDRMVFDDGETIDNPRWYRESMTALEALQQDRAKCRSGSRRHRKLTVAIAKLHLSISNRRKDWLHKLSAKLVAENELLATEELAMANLLRRPQPRPEVSPDGKETVQFLPNGAAAKAGLNRENGSAGMSFLLQLIGYKAAEAGIRFHVSNTRKLKPTQRCACCGTLIKKRLNERMHLCTHCGFVATRDRNAALVCLIDALWPTFYAAKSKGKPFTPDGYAAFVRNRLLYAATKVTTGDVAESPSPEGQIGPAHGIGAVIGQKALRFEVRETPTYSLQG